MQVIVHLTLTLTRNFCSATGKVVTSVQGATKPDVDRAVEAAQKAYSTVWGLKTSGTERARLLNKLADLWEAHMDELAAIEALDGGTDTFNLPVCGR